MKKAIILTAEQIKQVFEAWNKEVEGKTHTPSIKDSEIQSDTFYEIADRLFPCRKKAVIKRINHDSENPSDKEFFYELYAENGEPTDTSQGFVSKQGCKDTLAHQHPEYDVVDETI
jgi:hypothetical protein